MSASTGSAIGAASKLLHVAIRAAMRVLIGPGDARLVVWYGHRAGDGAARMVLGAG